MPKSKDPTKKSCASVLLSILSKPKDLVVWYLLASAALIGKVSAATPVVTNQDPVVIFKVGGDRHYSAKPGETVVPAGNTCKVTAVGSEIPSNPNDVFPLHQLCNLESKPIREEILANRFTGDIFKDRTLTRFFHKEGETVVSDLDFSRGSDVVVEHRKVIRY